MENTTLPPDPSCDKPSSEPQERRAPSALFAQNEVIETLAPIESPRWWTPIPPPPKKKSTTFVRPKFETKSAPTPPPAQYPDPRKSDLQRLANQLVGEPEALTVKPPAKTKLHPGSRRTGRSVGQQQFNHGWKKYAAAALFVLAAALAMYQLPALSRANENVTGTTNSVAAPPDETPRATMDSRVRQEE
jgi:hypothetical protein